MHSDPSSRVGVGSVMAWMGNAPSLVSLVTTNTANFQSLRIYRVGRPRPITACLAGEGS